jgi:predicted MPP superfamily phosphohydrolase
MGLRLHRFNVPTPGLDPAHDGLKVAHLTDLHVGLLTPHRRIARAFEWAQAENPDVLLLTGDFICYNKKFVAHLAEITSAIRVPTFAVLGNHDYWTDAQGVRKALEKNGVEVLANQHTTIRVRGAPLEIVGIDDAITQHDDAARAFHGTHKGRSRLVMTHAPNLADQAADFGGALVVAGHTHGGHVHIPKVTAHLFRKLIGARYLKGWYDVEPVRLYVNCGVGSSSVPIRAGAPSEAAVFRLGVPSDDDATRLTLPRSLPHPLR